MRKTKLLVLLIGGLAFLGFVDATYLTAQHYLGAPVPCVLLAGCDTVLTSAYAKVGPVPVALLGSLFYLAVLISAILFLDLGSRRLLRFIFVLGVLGLAAALYFGFIQAFVLEAFCTYCLASALFSLLIFFLAWGGKFFRRAESASA